MTDLKSESWERKRDGGGRGEISYNYKGDLVRRLEEEEREVKLIK